MVDMEWTLNSFVLIREDASCELSCAGQQPCDYLRLFFKSMGPRQNGRLFTDDTFKRIFLNENIRISTKNSLKFVPKGLIINILALVLIMAWHLPGGKPLSEPMLVRSLTYICVTRTQWVCSWVAGIVLYMRPAKLKTRLPFAGRIHKINPCGWSIWRVIV